MEFGHAGVTDQGGENPRFFGLPVQVQKGLFRVDIYANLGGAVLEPITERGGGAAGWPQAEAISLGAHLPQAAFPLQGHEDGCDTGMPGLGPQFSLCACVDPGA